MLIERSKNTLFETNLHFQHIGTNLTLENVALLERRTIYLSFDTSTNSLRRT